MNFLYSEVKVLKQYGKYLNVVGPLWNHSTKKGREYLKCKGRIFSLVKSLWPGKGPHIVISGEIRKQPKNWLFRNKDFKDTA